MSRSEAQKQEQQLNNGTEEVAEKEGERLSEVLFDMALANSQYIKPIRMHFKRRGQQLTWDMAVEHDNVAVVLFHVERRQLLLVKQFRPPVFIHAVRTRPENVGKPLASIEWAHYPVEMGETLELCAGLMDKPGKSSLEHVQEEVLEECGYRVPAHKMESIKRYVTGISISGAAQHLFYAEIDESMRATEGGGNPEEGEFIKKVFLSLDECRALLRQENIVSPPSMLYALGWWLQERLPKLEEQKEEEKEANAAH